MQLKRLEAYGFKSFADKISIEFDKGITAIVGPNGSGKSNITDAIRWVLGEQNVRNLRGTKAEDIIFTGSAERRALGLAEVSLIFANEGDLPVDFREVVVTRRLYRSGESEFYINRSRCRLKDIYNLFADTGIGHDGMSIIGQNRIDDILNSRPEERRAFFEETAGITKYRNRKRETVRKITDTDSNLVRVRDIIHEIENQLEPLARHAERTRSYNALNESYKACKLTKLAGDFACESARKAENDAKLEKARDEEVEASAQIRVAEAEKEMLDQGILTIEAAMQEKAQENEAQRQKIEQAEREMAALRERQSQSEVAHKRILARRAELSSEIAAIVAEIGKLTALEQEQKEHLQKSEAALREEKEEASKVAARVRLCRDEARTAREKRAEKQQEFAQKQQELAVLDRDIEKEEEGKDNRAQEIRAAKESLAQYEKRKEKLAHEKEAQENERSAARREQAATEKKAQEMRRALRDLDAHIMALRQKQTAAESKVQVLARMQQAYEGFGKATKAVLKSHESWRGGIAGAIAELIDVPKDCVTAIETALGGSLQNIVTQDTDTAKAAIAFLKRERLGRVTFLPLSTLVTRRPPDEAVRGAAGVIGWANAIVKTEAAYQRAIDFLLARTLVVDTLDHALGLARRHGQRLRIVTLGGELLNPGGSLSGGSRGHAETSFLNRGGEIELLRTSLQEWHTERATLAAAKKQLIEDAAKVETARHTAEEAVHAAGLACAEMRVNLERLDENFSEQQGKVKALEEAAARASESFAKVQNRRVFLVRAVRAAEQEVNAFTRAEEAARERLADVEEEANTFAASIQEHELSRAVLEQEAMRSREHILLRQRDKKRSERALIENEQEERDLAELAGRSTERLASLSHDAKAWQEVFHAGKAARDALYAKRMETIEKSQAADQKTRAIGRKHSEIQARIHQLELSGAKMELALSEWQETILAEYGLTPERAEEKAIDLPPQELHAKMKELERQIAALGPINPNAVQEYEELRARHAFLDKQATDLETAKGDLARIIMEMDAVMTRQFKEAFAKIQEYFAEIFARLFGGGKAELKLIDETDVLNTGVDILVVLPQKKRQNLSALSGGERALTVIALLFSFLRYRPSPFSVLDEIDAPLDEANVARFGSFLKEFAEGTQFIVVTHRKGTMEAVDTMYGVTLEDAGASKVLSVKLDEVGPAS